MTKPRKETSSRISALAARYLRLDDDDMRKEIMWPDGQKQVFADIRSMAASLLSQDETSEKP